jgi:hypothetical protein
VEIAVGVAAVAGVAVPVGVAGSSPSRMAAAVALLAMPFL